MIDFEAIRERAVRDLDLISHTLRTTAEARPECLDRLVHDRDELLYHAHANGQIPVVELADRYGIPWPQTYAIIDRVRDEHLGPIRGTRERPADPRLVLDETGG